jgi:AcrR family transcriptional regulator
MSTAVRKSREVRRDEIIEAATIEFADRGLAGASTEDIARRAGISQPYVFRLFGTKKDLFKAVVSRCFRETLELFQRAAEGLRGAAALEAIGQAYIARLVEEPVRLRVQLQAYAACDDAEICAAVRAGYGDLVVYVERVSGLGPTEVARFFAQGMLLNVFAAMGHVGGEPEPWAERLLSGCKTDGVE